MSRHLARSCLDGCDVELVAGFDRRLGRFFLDVFDVTSDDDDGVRYTSLAEPWLNWTDVDALASRLRELALPVPPTLLPALRADAPSNAGNRIVRHRVDAGPETLLEG